MQTAIQNFGINETDDIFINKPLSVLWAETHCPWAVGGAAVLSIAAGFTKRRKPTMLLSTQSSIIEDSVGSFLGLCLGDLLFYLFGAVRMCLYAAPYKYRGIMVQDFL